MGDSATQDERRRRAYDNQWHLDKRLNVGHILTTILIIFSFMAWANTQDKRITTLEVQQKYSDQIANEIKDQLTKLNQKMDKLVERELNRNNHPHRNGE